MSIHKPRQGFTLIELLVVISIIAILAGLLLPAVTMVRGRANQTANANSQKQIVTAMLAYSIDYDGAYPAATRDGAAFPTVSAAGAAHKAIVYASLETLAASTGLPNAIFKARGQTGESPDGAPLPVTATTPTAFSASTWVSGNREIAWAYDWTVPAESASYRIITADRQNFHRANVVAVAVDSSVRSLRASATAPGGQLTVGFGAETLGQNTQNGVPIQGTLNPDAVGGGLNGENTAGGDDSIYSDVRDATGATGAAADGNNHRNNGSPRRAWVK